MAISAFNVRDELEFSEEIFSMTFQVAMVGKDGILLASDRKRTSFDESHAGMQPQRQFSLTSKIIHNEQTGIICAFAGGRTSQAIARLVSELDPSNYSDTTWYAALRDVTASVERDIQARLLDEILVIRPSVLDKIDLIGKVTARGNDTIEPIFDRHCAGDSFSLARFLSQHFYQRDSYISDLLPLALLTMAYAHYENPTGIGKEVEVIICTKDGVQHLEADNVGQNIAPFHVAVWEQINAFNVPLRKIK